mgnify:CR=1 FL=1
MNIAEVKALRVIVWHGRLQTKYPVNNEHADQFRNSMQVCVAIATQQEALRMAMLFEIEPSTVRRAKAVMFATFAFN